MLKTEGKRALEAVLEIARGVSSQRLSGALRQRRNGLAQEQLAWTPHSTPGSWAPALFVRPEIFMEILSAPALKIARQPAGFAGRGFHASGTPEKEIEVNR